MIQCHLKQTKKYTSSLLRWAGRSRNIFSSDSSSHHLSPQSVLCGNVHIGEGSWIGAGSIVIPGVKIGKWCVIAAGSVVTKDIPDYSLAAGNRAKVIKSLR
ncbi:MAG: hypothetical protein H3C41_11475 [Bacteroidales bacterium]|nr:hypothetical protein [Bacteroidales bacterium]